MLIFQILIHYAECEIRIFLEEQQKAREQFPHVHKFVRRFTLMQHLTRSAISKCFSSKFIGKSKQKPSQISVT